MKTRCVYVLSWAIVASGAWTANAAEAGSPAEPEGSAYFDMSLEDLLDITVSDEDQQGLRLYGYLGARLERAFKIASVDGGGETVKASDPWEWSASGFHLYGTAQINRDLSALFNIEGDGETISLRNAWGNLKISDGLQFRSGMTYRRFDLFNEKLDQLPAFLGIEPPELFDGDHLMLPRTSLFMVHGEKALGQGTLSWSLDTDNGEGGPQNGVVPVGWDARYRTGTILFGISGYMSSLGDARTAPGVSLGDGAPTGGVLPWMSGDKYSVFGAFVEAARGQLLLQAAFWTADHDALRDPASVVTLHDQAGINAAQQERFFGAGATSFTESDVVVPVTYTVSSWYLRLGYTFETAIGSMTPYGFLDYMSHPEVIQEKDFGGDNEAGYADDGKFLKPSLGVVYKPDPAVAIKLDGSTHIQEFNGQSESYPEVRLDISYAFKM